jgi:hypothetical protein
VLVVPEPSIIPISDHVMPLSERSMVMKSLFVSVSVDHFKDTDLEREVAVHVFNSIGKVPSGLWANVFEAMSSRNRKGKKEYFILKIEL